MKVDILSTDDRLIQTLGKVIKDYGIKKLITAEVKAYKNIKNFLNSEDEFDILFVDDYSSTRSALEITRMVRAVYPEAVIVIVSANSDKVYDAFSLKVYRFLLKPFSRDALYEALDSFRREQMSTNFLIVKTKGGFKSFKMGEVMYLEADGKICSIHTTTDVIQTYTSYSQAVEQLPDEYFYQCHRSFTVNMKYVNQFTGEEIHLINNAVVPLSRRRKMDFYIKFNEFVKSHTF